MSKVRHAASSVATSISVVAIALAALTSYLRTRDAGLLSQVLECQVSAML